MEPISEDLVDETLEGFAELSPDQAYEMGLTVGNSQPELLSFIVEMTEEYEQVIREHTIYMFYVIYVMFQNGYGKEIEKISYDEIIECYENNRRLVENLGGAHEKFFERVTRVQVASQPYVIRYVVETLFEAGQGEDPILQEEEDIGYLFLLMKTVIDLLNKKTDI